jgi:hypothetical protein
MLVKFDDMASFRLTNPWKNPRATQAIFERSLKISSTMRGCLARHFSLYKKKTLIRDPKRVDRLLEESSNYHCQHEVALKRVDHLRKRGPPKVQSK